MVVANCSACGKVFPKSFSEYCTDCHEEQEQFRRDFYKYIQDNAGVTLQALSEAFELPLKEIEAMVETWDLGTAKNHVMMQCKMCKSDVLFSQRKGYYCSECAESFKSKLDKLQSSEADSVSEQRSPEYQAYVESVESRQQANKEGQRYGFHKKRKTVGKG